MILLPPKTGFRIDRRMQMKSVGIFLATGTIQGGMSSCAKKASHNQSRELGRRLIGFKFPFGYLNQQHNFPGPLAGLRQQMEV